MILRAVLAATTAAAMVTGAAPSGPAPVLVLDQIALHDSTVMQGFAAAPGPSWIFSQLTQDGRAGLTGAQHAARGDITLTRAGPAGKIWGWMFLSGFGHGISVAVQPRPGGFWVWTETAAVPDVHDPAHGYGTKIARFAWAPGATLSMSSPGVEVFGPNPGATHQTVSLDLAHGLIAERYVSVTLGVPRIAVYRLADFTAHTYPALRRITVPPSVAAQTSQGWAILPGGTEVAYLTGDPYTGTNPPPGNAELTVFGAGGVVSVTPLTEGAGLVYREPEGVTVAAGRLCHGFASGPAGARRASIYCRSLEDL